jgi:hypothetical protein
VPGEKKRKDKDKAAPTSQARKIIIPGAPSQSLAFEEFSTLIATEDLEKLAKILGVAPRFRDSLARLIWSFYRNSLSGAEIKISRAVLVRKLGRAAERAEELEKLAEELWASEDPIVLRELAEFVPVGLDLPSSRSHRSGVAFVGVLSAFALKIQWLAQTLPDDPGGPRRAMPFDRLVIGLGECYRGLTGEEPAVTTKGRFFRFVSDVTDVLRKLQKRLPSADFNLPQDNKALYMRLQRLVTKHQV